MKKPGTTIMIIIIYATIILGSLVYFGFMQHFGTGGLEFHIAGRDNTVTVFDMLIIIIIPVAIVLFIISVIAWYRKRDTKLFIISAAFFFFAVKEFLFLFENFFPREFIFIGNAERALELLILLSFVFLLYKK